MSKTAVIYKSKTGFTRKYAQWIAEETGCDLFPYEQREKVDFSRYDTILYGGGFYAGTIGGLKWFKKSCLNCPERKLPYLRQAPRLPIHWRRKRQ